MAARQARSKRPPSVPYESSNSRTEPPPKGVSSSFPVVGVSSYIEMCLIQGIANLDDEEAEGIDADQCEVFTVR